MLILRLKKENKLTVVIESKNPINVSTEQECNHDAKKTDQEANHGTEKSEQETSQDIDKTEQEIDHEAEKTEQETNHEGVDSHHISQTAEEEIMKPDTHQLRRIGLMLLSVVTGEANSNALERPDVETVDC